MLHNFPPSFEVIGEIKSVDYREPTALKKTPAMKVFVQFGPRRTGDGRKEVNFINGMHVRVPFFVHQRISDKMVPGAIVHIKGHLQGVYKAVQESVGIEAVAERVSFSRAEDMVQGTGPDDASTAAADGAVAAGADGDVAVRADE